MNTDLIRPELKIVHSLDRFACYYMSIDDLVKFYPEVRMYTIGDCSDISKIARCLLNEYLYILLSKIDFLDFSSFVSKRYKVGLLIANGINAIDDDDDDLFMRLKNLGEAKVIKTLCTDEFMQGTFPYRRNA